MTIRDVRNAIQYITSKYFAGATVVWAQTNMTKPKPPFITLQLGDVRRATWPDKVVVNGIQTYYYPSQVQLTVNLFTRGAKIMRDGETVAREDTSESDMLGFVNFVNSDYFIAWENTQDLYIYPSAPVRNLTELINDTNWEYRSMVELTVAYTESVSGAAAVWNDPSGGWEPTPSGGGSQELADETTGYFEQVDIEYTNDPIDN